MNTMTLSPMQPSKGYLTREEFRDHDQYMRDGFEKVFEQIDNVENILTDRIDLFEAHTNIRFDVLETKIDKRFDVVDKKFSEIDRKIDGLEIKINNITTLLTQKNN